MREELYKEWQHKSVAVIGLGVSNVPLIRFLQRYGAVISGRDRKTEAQFGDGYSALAALGIDLVLGEGYLDGLEQYDAVFLAPGIPKNIPEIQGLQGRTEVLSEIALVLRYSRAPIYGITGSSGKTTTTALVGEMLKHAGHNVFVGGNIGTPLIEQIEDIPADGKIVLELSSFQLEQLTESPHGALVTNLTENHLDIHGTMANYIAAKKHIYLHQSAGDFGVFNDDDPITRQMADEAISQTYLFSMRHEVERGAFQDGDSLIFKDESGSTSFAMRDEIALLGEHNVANLLAAAAISRLAGADWQAVHDVACSFTGVPHRLELVGEHEGVQYFNDSIATSPARAIAGLRTFTNPIILIAGGYDKKLSFGELAAVIHDRAKALIVLGTTAPKISDAVQQLGEFPIYQVADLPEATALSRRLAVTGDVVLLSPACASFDMYRSFEERGAHFRELVTGFTRGNSKEG